MSIEPDISVEQLAPTGERTDFLVRVVGPGDTDYTFRLSITRTISRVWAVNMARAAEELADALVFSHGTASAFPGDGFWFDSYSSADTVAETRNLIANKSWRAFLHPAAKESLGAALFEALNQLDESFAAHEDRPFVKALDILFERSQALEDLETEAIDNPHFIYRVCILSGVIDRFNFASPSLGGLRDWLSSRFDAERASELTRTFQMVKNLRKQYPIHEHFDLDAAGERERRHEVVQAESYFNLRLDQPDFAGNWHKVLSKFADDLGKLHAAIEGLPERDQGGGAG
jgi:hypothetical protein